VKQGKDKPAAAAEARAPLRSMYDVDLERQRLEFEIRKFEAEERAHRENLEMQEKLKRLELETQEKLKMDELRLLERQHADKVKESDSPVMRAKRYGDAIKSSLIAMGPEPPYVIAFFRHAESVFDQFKVPSELYALLLQPYLNQKARSVVGRMDPSLCRDYKVMRDVILKEHKLSPCTYLEYFNNATRTVGETCMMFSSRLKAFLAMYIESRKIGSSLEDLLALIV
jgi:hypothetical protein